MGKQPLATFLWTAIIHDQIPGCCPEAGAGRIWSGRTWPCHNRYQPKTWSNWYCQKKRKGVGCWIQLAPAGTPLCQADRWTKICKKPEMGKIFATKKWENPWKYNNQRARHRILAGSVYSFVSMLFHLIPEAGCGRSPQAFINTGFLDISGGRKSTKE